MQRTFVPLLTRPPVWRRGIATSIPRSSIYRSVPCYALHRSEPAFGLRRSEPMFAMKRSIVPRNPLVQALVRIIVQAGMVAVPALFRALAGAWQEAAKGGGAARALGRSKMSIDEAARVLELDAKTVTPEKLQERVVKMKEINEATDKFAGSPYLQQKVDVANQILQEHIADSQGHKGQKPHKPES
eukprot:GDKH01005284.1.p1 GENE.GDKH01005284.1~~GDKH01005284.1.p1  ORF type:complete len:186 (-),score=11.99 GDKH01005284.1:312-869(-)